VKNTTSQPALIYTNTGRGEKSGNDRPPVDKCYYFIMIRLAQKSLLQWWENQVVNKWHLNISAYTKLYHWQMHLTVRMSSLWPGFNLRPWRSISRDFTLADHTLPARPEPAWQKRAQSPLNGTTQPVEIEEEGQSPTTDRRWLIEKMHLDWFYHFHNYEVFKSININII